MIAQWFWLGTTILCLLWYSVITLYVGVKGMHDIRSMLDRLKRGDSIDGRPNEP